MITAATQAMISTPDIVATRRRTKRLEDISRLSQLDLGKAKWYATIGLAKLRDVSLVTLVQAQGPHTTGQSVADKVTERLDGVASFGLEEFTGTYGRETVAERSRGGESEGGRGGERRMGTATGMTTAA